MVDKIIQFLKKFKIEFCENFDISALSSIKIGGRVRLVVFPKNTAELESVVKFFWSLKIDYKVI